MIQVEAIKAFSDNYIWVIKNSATNHCLLVDPGQAQPVLNYLSAEQLTLEAILITHKHADHVGGVNEILESHPDVIEAAVGSYPDEVLGEKICAYVVLADGKEMTLDGLVSFFEQEKVAKFKWPERLKVLDALPRNPMNKVMRSELG